VARKHIEERLSYRVLAKRFGEELGIGTSKSSLSKMVMEVGKESKTDVEIAREEELSWRGYVSVDEKFIRFRGNKIPIYVAVDSSGDIVAWQRQNELTEEAIKRFFIHLTDEVGYQVKGITTDLDPKLEKVIQTLFGDKCKHQKCLWHAQEVIDGLLDYARLKRSYRKIQKLTKEAFLSLPDRKTLKLYRWRLDVFRRYRERLQSLKQQLDTITIVRKAVEEILWSRSPVQAEERFEIFKRRYRRHYSTVVNFLRCHWEGLTNYLRDRKLLPTNNLIENVMKQLERRFKTIEGFKSVSSLDGYLNLLFLYLRCKPYTDCRGHREHLNGKSRLEIVGGSQKTKNWILFASKSR